MKAAHTEVKSTLANIHAAQALHMTDKNVYAGDFTDIDIQTSSDGQFLYGKAVSNNGANAKVSTGDENKIALLGGDVEYFVVAVAEKRLAGCADASKKEVWCLNDNKLITNERSVAQAAEKSTTANPVTQRCASVAKNTVDTTDKC